MISLPSTWAVCHQGNIFSQREQAESEHVGFRVAHPVVNAVTALADALEERSVLYLRQRVRSPQDTQGFPELPGAHGVGVRWIVEWRHQNVDGKSGCCVIVRETARQ